MAASTQSVPLGQRRAHTGAYQPIAMARPPHGALILASEALATVTAVVAVGAIGTPMVVFSAIAIATHAVMRPLNDRLNLSVLDDVPRLSARAAVAGGIAGALGPHLRLTLAAAIFVVVAAVSRAPIYRFIEGSRVRGREVRRAIIVGTGAVGIELAELMREHPKYGLSPVGFVDSYPLGGQPLPAPLLGGHDDLRTKVTEEAISHVFIASDAASDEQLVRCLRACDGLDCICYALPRLFQTGLAGQPTTDHLWGLPLVRVRHAPPQGLSWRIKRVIDVVVSATALVLLAPLLGIVALVVRIGIGPGVLFRQQRVGLHGQHFQMLKFRTLYPADPGSVSQWSVVDDYRLGPVGHFLRHTFLDELPQFWNVLCGHMSLVGPRPELPCFAREFSTSLPRYDARLRVRPGITGWAQVHHLYGHTSLRDRVRFDNSYIETWSLWRDAKILARTVGCVAAAVWTLRLGVAHQRRTRSTMPLLLMYHSVAPRHHDPHHITVSPHRFAAQMGWLQRRGLRGVSVRDLLDARARGDGDDLVGLTFDDGYADFVTEALPVLQQHGFGATVFVVAGKLGGVNDWDGPDEPKPLMTAAQVRQAAAAGIEIGSHGLRHTNLAQQDPRELFDEVQTSREILSELVGCAIDGFCYPYGVIGRDTTAAVSGAGYRYACAVSADASRDAFEIPRVFVGERDHAWRLVIKQWRHKLIWG